MIKIKQSKPITELRHGDKIKINSRELEVDANIILIDHDEETKEMAVECFDPKTDEDFQLRYFTNNVENSLELYKLKNEFMYSKSQDELKTAEW